MIGSYDWYVSMAGVSFSIGILVQKESSFSHKVSMSFGRNPEHHYHHQPLAEWSMFYMNHPFW